MAQIDKKIVDAYKNWLLDSVELTWEFSHHESCPDCKPERKNVFIETLDGIKHAGYHEDVVERCKFALLSPQGFEVFRNLPKKFDYEYLVQELLSVYKDITD